MIRESLDFINRNFLAETRINYTDRAEADSVKIVLFAVIEDAVVNAMYH
jgi:hypothetical protein